MKTKLDPREKELLLGRGEGELSPAERAEAETLLASRSDASAWLHGHDAALALVRRGLEAPNAAPALDWAALAQRLRRRRRRGGWVAAAAAASAALVIAGSALFAALRPERAALDTAAEVAALRAEIVALRLAIELGHGPPGPYYPAADALARAGWEQAAGMMLGIAIQVEMQSANPEAARTRYTFVVENYPGARAAEEAQRRLAALDSPKST